MAQGEKIQLEDNKKRWAQGENTQLYGKKKAGEEEIERWRKMKWKRNRNVCANGKQKCRLQIRQEKKSCICMQTQRNEEGACKEGER